MITRKEVAGAAASGQLESMPWFRRLTVALHLSMCRHCSRFVRQLKLMRRASRQIHLETAPLGRGARSAGPTQADESRILQESMGGFR